MVYIAERKHSVFRTVSCTIKDLILAATALLPIGPNINDEFLRTSDSALGAKVKALNLIETYHLKNVMTDETALDLFCSLIGAHLFYNQSLFDVTLEETFLVLEVEGTMFLVFTQVSKERCAPKHELVHTIYIARRKRKKKSRSTHP